MVVDIGRQALTTMLLVAAPMLGFGLLVGLVVSIFQAVTQINEMTLTFVPKILAVSVAILIFLPWMIRVMVSFTSRLIASIGGL
jgi:flagellar biosynthetic protein FliQ